MSRKTEDDLGSTPQPGAGDEQEPTPQAESASAEAEGAVPHDDAPGDAVSRERDRLDAQLKRAMADLQNIRKRHLKEIADARTRAVEALAGELLPVLDNFDLALAAQERQTDAPQGDASAMVEGVRMVQSLLRGVLERHGLAEIEALGAAFDPNVHEAVGVDTQSDAEPNTVSAVVQTGYLMGDRLVRPAKVMVAAPPTSAGAPEADDA